MRRRLPRRPHRSSGRERSPPKTEPGPGAKRSSAHPGRESAPDRCGRLSVDSSCASLGDPQSQRSILTVAPCSTPEIEMLRRPLESALFPTRAMPIAGWISKLVARSNGPDVPGVADATPLDPPATSSGTRVAVAANALRRRNSRLDISIDHPVWEKRKRDPPTGFTTAARVKMLANRGNRSADPRLVPTEPRTTRDRYGGGSSRSIALWTKLMVAS